ncbi:relaxase [Micromonospora sp. NPDC049662]|uniref:relaxase/mobilization nuclease domain-containing protein n=1 Tax=Micromonospora sp. NPDC049662 TaxID=3155397 RepID=UPI003431CF5D
MAAWDGAGPLSRLEPTAGPGGKLDFQQLVDLLEQPVRAGRNPPQRTVWHTSVRNHASDRMLSDPQWAHIAREMVAGSGLAPHGDARAVRWIAVRHADDHIHIVATLVRQDRRTEWGRNDRWRCQQTARDLEERYGLHRVGPADRTADTRAHRVEVNKARRTGRREPARDRLRREVRFAAAAAGTSAEFFDLLRAAGLQVRLRHSSADPEQVTGYAVALDGHTTADGKPVWYGGGRLAPDLTLPQLRTRWDETRTGEAAPPLVEQAEVYQQAAEQVRAAAEDIRQRTAGGQGAAGAAAYAAADALTVTARMMEGDNPRGPLHRAARALDRATREPYRRPLPRTRRAEGLRSMSRLMKLAGHLSDNKAVFEALRLVMQMSLLADALADMRESQQRLHQVRAARTAARLLRTAGTRHGATSPTVADAGVTPQPTPPSTPPPTAAHDRRRQARSTNTGRSR